ncbi:TetR family transcriptional regulator [Rhodococcus erythropolis]|uniref:TetR/AcrR family transcriptional regulator n=1 Tax=Rhodococcus erythropolis TaxID=1833 RepID=UPI00129167EA|nr:TetR/AcrR family transcriptional regulator [Rhodococcus erythropolis]MQP33292.1 TetR family transcriptional regulator [Rhodococcus erythropolis]
MSTDKLDSGPIKGKRTPVATTRTNPRRELVENQIFEQAIALFSERGFAATTLQDIANATGLTRPALYHYVKSKDDLLAKLVNQDTGGIADQLHQVSGDSTRNAIDRLYSMVHESAHRLAQDPARFRLLLRSESELPDAVFRAYDSGRRRVLKEFTTVIQDGINAGQMRPVDARTAALAIIGMTNWIAWWHTPGQKSTAEKIAAQFADMAVAAVSLPNERREAMDGPHGAISMLRQDIDLLENLLADRSSGKST